MSTVSDLGPLLRTILAVLGSSWALVGGSLRPKSDPTQEPKHITCTDCELRGIGVEVVDALGMVLGGLGPILGPLGVVFVSSWDPLGDILRRSWRSYSTLGRLWVAH